ncbi:MAG: hypothetical protein HY725_01455 [Candidatus Rokubacteria bacterium]|nr:hypothetical protein [Candidatus Rokubacteria bacterium]
MILIVVFYLVLGTFMDGLAIMVTTMPVILPNLYVIHGLRERATAEQRRQTMMDVCVGVMPFFVMMIVAIVILMLFPQIALWLPTTMKGG